MFLQSSAARGCTTAGGAVVLLVFSLVVDPVLT
jgi:hypothetical protein